MSARVVEEEILRLEKAWVYNGLVLTLKIEIKIDREKTAFPSFNELTVNMVCGSLLWLQYLYPRINTGYTALTVCRAVVHYFMIVASHSLFLF